jgi:hypothetical protein
MEQSEQTALVRRSSEAIDQNGAAGPARDPFLFIVGCERSGTTLLRAMLASHPDVAIPDESYFIPRLARRRHAYHARQHGFLSGRFLDDLARDPEYQRWTISRSAVQRAFEDRPPLDYSDAIRRVFEVYAAARGKSRYGDKTPVYVRYIDRLAALFPEAVFVHILRDGRDVAMSLVDRTHERPHDVGEAAIFWRERVRAGRRLGTPLGARYQEIQYDDLVSDPRCILESVCGLARLRFGDDAVAAMLRYPEHAEELVADAHNTAAHDRIRQPPTPGVRNWRREMPIADRRLVEALAGDVLGAAGYPVETPAAGRDRVIIAARSTLARLRWTLLHVWFLGQLVVRRLSRN